MDVEEPLAPHLERAAVDVTVGVHHLCGHLINHVSVFHVGAFPRTGTEPSWIAAGARNVDRLGGIERVSAHSWLLVALSAVAGGVSLWALTKKRYTLAPLAAALAVAAVIWGWLVAQYPLLVPPAISIESAKGPSMVMRTMVVSIGLGALLLLPSLAYLFYLFKGHRPEGAVQK